MGMPFQEAGPGCQQHSTAGTPAVSRNKSSSKTRRLEGIKEEEEGGDEEIMGYGSPNSDGKREKLSWEEGM